MGAKTFIYGMYVEASATGMRLMTIETEKNQRDKVNFVHQFNLDGSDIEYKTVGRGNTSSSRVNLPKEWESKKVAVVLLE